METLFEKAVIRIGIDTIRIKLTRSIYGNDPMDQLIDNLKNSLDPDEIKTFPKNGNYYVKDIDSNCYLAKIYKTGKDSCMIEIFGMCQTVTNFKLTEHHATILSIIGNLTGIEMTLQKIDVALDFFYPHDRTFVFDGSGGRDFVDILNYQIKSPFVHLTKIPMTTIRVPKSQKKIIKFALDHKDIKSPEENNKHGDCYCRWVKPTAHYLNRTNYSKCEKAESSHFEIKINDRKILYRIMDYFDGSETFSSDYDHETETYISKGSKKVSNIKYDKSRRDEEKGKDVQDVCNAIVEEMADNDDEYDDLIDHFKHTRIESRLFEPCITKKEKNPLDLTLELSYDKLLDYIKETIKKEIGIIFILKPDISTDDYLNLYKERLKKVNIINIKYEFFKEKTSESYGRILEVTPDAWNDFENQINVLKSKFIPDVKSPIRQLVGNLGRRS